MAEAFSSAENTYIINIESGAETARLLDQDRLVTFFMQSLFPPAVDLSKIRRVLDIACGPGEWVRDVAFHYPEMEVVGVDVNRTMIEYARDMALVRKLNNATYRVMNVLDPLDFPDNSFDFVNARFMVGFMPPPAWPRLIKECMRITRPGGIIRMTECDDMGTSNSPAYNRLLGIGLTAMQKAGRTLFPEGRTIGITTMLGRFLRDAGCENIQSAAYAIDYSAGERAHAAVCLDIQMATKLSQPFLVKTGVTSNEEIDALYEQMVNEMETEAFLGLWTILSVWGEKP